MIFFSEKNWQLINAEKACMVEGFNSYESAKQRFETHRLKALYLVDGQGQLMAVLSKGEFLSSPNKLNWNYTPNFLILGKKLSDKNLENLRQYNSLPILNEKGQVIKVLESFDYKGIRVNNTVFKPYEKAMIIAEIGNNHNGAISTAKKLIEKAAKSGVDGVKFQARSLSDLYVDLSEEYLNQTDFGTAYTLNQLKRFNLNQKDLAELFVYAKSLGLIVICTPFDVKSAAFLKQQKVDLIKIASADMSNYNLLEQFVDSTIPLLISTGMHEEKSIENLSRWLKKHYVEATLLHVNSTYPTPYSDVNLRYMTTLGKYSTTGLFGYSGHERGIHIPLAAVAMGATVVEKHFTLDKSLEGNDHKVSLLPEELKALTENVNSLTTALGNNHKFKIVTQGEKLNKLALSKGIYTNKKLSKGCFLQQEDISYLSPCVGITAEEAPLYIGKTLTVNLDQKQPITKSCFEDRETKLAFKQIKNYGLPVRFRDLEAIGKTFEPVFLEYHMFSTDLNAEPHQYKDILSGKTLSVHAPEQFEDGFILDLVSEKPEIYQKSLELFDRIVLWTTEIQKATGQDQINLIVNVGGATNDEKQVYQFNKETAFEKLAQVNTLCNKKGITMLPQTMPPFPWHFGGQGFHRLFVDPKDMTAIQKWTPMKFCMDFSHTYMSCAHLGKDFYQVLDEVSNYFDYLHIADAIYPGEEGINIMEGDIDFKRLKKYFTSKDYRWIPEIWNGHLNHFEGFRNALKVLDLI